MPSDDETINVKSRRVVIVTGMSGAGKTVALHALEDIGFEAVDNIPITLIDLLLNDPRDEEANFSPIAIGVDTRSRAFTPNVLCDIIDGLRQQPQIDLSVLFFDCDETILVNRFSETRRVHHLAPGRPVRDGIAMERDLLKSIRERADSLVDTSNITSATARKRLQDKFRVGADGGMLVTVMSFGFSKGVPRDIDLIFDVRFLRNPHYEPTLRDLTGQNEKVATYIMADENFIIFRRKVMDMLDFLIPLYEAEGKHYLTIGFGCTGGKHRSVMTTEWVGKKLQQSGHLINITHRDMPESI